VSTHSGGVSAKLQKYIHKHGIETAPGRANRLIKIVIPAFAERESIHQPLACLCAQKAACEAAEIIVVVNNVEGDQSSRFDDNQKTLRFLGPDSRMRKALLEAGYHFTLIDRSSPGRGFAPKIAGVGAARKAGLDYGLGALLDLEGKGLLVSLDADCSVPENYLAALIEWERDKEDFGAGIIDYAHPFPEDAAHRQAIALYEIRLRYTERALQATGTPYAFATIGSTIICRPNAYVMAGGMNTRKATEDFYFLMNLAKATSIDAIHSTLVTPGARVSDRVYLGTGHGVGKLLGNAEPFLLEQPDCYRIVGRALKILLDGNERSPDETLREIAENTAELMPFFESKSLRDTLRETAAGTRTRRSYERRIHQWFDALKIRQAVRFLSEHHYPMILWDKAVGELTEIHEGGDPVRTLLGLRGS